MSGQRHHRQRQQRRRQDPPGAPTPERTHRDVTAASMLGEEQAGYQVTGQREEQRHAQEAAASPAKAEVEEDDRSDGDGPHTVQPRQVRQAAGGVASARRRRMTTVRREDVVTFVRRRRRDRHRLHCGRDALRTASFARPAGLVPTTWRNDRPRFDRSQRRIDRRRRREPQRRRARRRDRSSDRHCGP